MSRVYYHALKSLPDAYVLNGTRTCELYGGRVIAVHPDLPPIIWDQLSGWREILFGPPTSYDPTPFLAGASAHKDLGEIS